MCSVNMYFKFIDGPKIYHTIIMIITNLEKISIKIITDL